MKKSNIIELAVKIVAPFVIVGIVMTLSALNMSGISIVCLLILMYLARYWYIAAAVYTAICFIPFTAKKGSKLLHYVIIPLAAAAAVIGVFFLCFIITDGESLVK